MKKHYFIFLLVMLIIPSCENTVIEDVDSDAPTLRSASIGIDGNSLFYNIECWNDGNSITPNVMKGKIFSRDGATYTFKFYTDLPKGCYSELTTNAQISRSKDFTDFRDGTFTAKLRPGENHFAITIVPNAMNIRAQGKLMIEKINGEGPVGWREDFWDLNVIAHGSMGAQGGSDPIVTEYHWLCNKCRYLNARGERCINCGSSS